ncbi:MAG: hypothetical protein Q7T34_02140 [Candidatus Parcubacteria bacterium]|nr:hypothetical protein [Candidatus Parcubacteria bacterium]
MHSEFINEEAKRFLKDGDLLLETIKEFKLPVLVGIQRIDEILFKDTYGLFANEGKDSNIQTCQGLFTHVVASLIGLEHLRWQTERGFKGTQNITFLPEFAVNRQAPDILPFPLILDSQVKYYYWEENSLDINLGKIPQRPLIKLGNTTAIRMYGFDALRDALHKFFLNPLGNLTALINAIRLITESPEETPIIWPMDIETPYIGSLENGSTLYRLLLSELEKQGLLKTFIPISQACDQMMKQGVEDTNAIPVRELTKWTSTESQIERINQLNRISLERPDDEYLLAIASTSDYFSALRRKANGPIRLPAVNLKGEKETLIIKHNQSVIDVCNAAYKALKEKKRLTDILKTQDIKKSPLKERIIKEVNL